jgi:hypothetical protein
MLKSSLTLKYQERLGLTLHLTKNLCYWKNVTHGKNSEGLFSKKGKG